MNLGASEKNEEIANKYKREVNVSLEMTSFWKLKRLVNMYQKKRIIY